jgi:flavodoxin I
MTPIGLIYGSDTGYTESVSNLIKEVFDEIAPNLITVHNIAETPIETLYDYDYLIIGCPTWDVGQLQDDWDNAFVELDDLNLTDKKMAIFGLGDQYGYPDSFCDAIGILGRKFKERGAKLVGFTSAEGLEFTHSRGVLGALEAEDGLFMGLALDDENYPERTPERVEMWIWQLVDEFDLVHLLDPVV